VSESKPPMTCPCRIEWRGAVRPAYGTPQIVFCPLHEEAGELFDALNELEAAVAEWREGENQSYRRLTDADEKAKELLAAIRKAES
jgi:hypothetical protein